MLGDSKTTGRLLYLRDRIHLLKILFPTGMDLLGLFSVFSCNK